MDLSVEQESIRELTQRKSTLLLELKNYEENQRVMSSFPGTNPGVGSGLPRGAGGKDMGIIPAQTQLSTALAINLGTDGRQVSSTLYSVRSQTYYTTPFPSSHMWKSAYPHRTTPSFGAYSFLLRESLKGSATSCIHESRLAPFMCPSSLQRISLLTCT